jgi:amino acid transporter
MGYKQELYRGFNAIMAFSFCFTAVGVVGSICGLFNTAVITGGPVVFVWSWIYVAIITVIISVAMGEICSAYPLSGSVYHWSGCIAPPKWSPFWSYITGWFNFLGNAAGDAFFASAFASTLNSLVQLTPDSSPLSSYAETAISLAASISWAVMALARVDKQGWLNNFTTLFQFASTIIICISTVVTCGQQGFVVLFYCQKFIKKMIRVTCFGR